MYKKFGISLLVALLIVSAFSQTVSAHTVNSVNPKAQSITKELMNWLAHLPNRSENRVLSGAFGGYTSATFSMTEANRIKNATGQLPAVYACDYSRGWMETANIADAIDYSCNNDLISHWKSGGIHQISMHLPNPAFQSGHYKTQISNSQYENILDPSTTEGKRLDAVLAKIADGLQQLENEGVPVLFRPLHEMNGEWFWWGLTGYNQKDNQRISLYKQLYQKIYHYMTDTRGLDNLIWVYAPDANRDFKTDFYPGSSYVDIVGLDAYFSDAYSIKGYDELTALNKPFAFTEVGPQTTNGSLDYSQFINAVKQKYPKTIYFLAWDEGWSPAANQGASNLYNDSWTLNKGEIWGGSSLTPIAE
ncbi:glycoside hydrolase family 26 protein [Bacillus sonorensis]|uniref:Mannan endo-1,4-beta-mannosidase n=1 Tax=Bacillus sonorensis L12 TaxID=1274524 RepID=M5P3T0_9BACI|nr:MULTISPECIES: glycoside hydrolase family 26 protein [Bacillus]TWK75206.1 Mannan endo-1,4-beta-mannosidase [Bacillus paralicheniformis]EME74108.1 beta-mannanase [Bacillus sonorensis L12]MCZ0073876.1 glycoside hydrolase family 26 protein [Bacillus sonorensis]MCZ0092498.1 glycoside hydrolase family 26 protein [Bacillus sonorensis]MEC0339852.1 glycoside hydrolase family 26 protein [Bacillus sonorensis]